MARIRSIHPGLFTDEAFMAVSVYARLLFIGIWTEAWDDGVFEWKPLTLKARIFPVDSVDLPALLNELEQAGVLARFSAGGKNFGVVRNFQKFQRPKKPNSSGVLPSDMLVYVGASGNGSELVPHQFPTSGENSPQMEDGIGVGKGEGEKKEKEAAQLRVSDPAPVRDELLDHLIDAAGLAEPLPPQLEDVSAIADLVGKGYSLRDRILPVIRSRRGKPFGSWGYFVKAIEEAEHRGSGVRNARVTMPVPSQWVPKGSELWTRLERARGSPIIVAYERGDPGVWVRSSEILALKEETAA